MGTHTHSHTHTDRLAPTLKLTLKSWPGLHVCAHLRVQIKTLSSRVESRARQSKVQQHDALEWYRVTLGLRCGLVSVQALPSALPSPSLPFP